MDYKEIEEYCQVVEHRELPVIIVVDVYFRNMDENRAPGVVRCTFRTFSYVIMWHVEQSIIHMAFEKSGRESLTAVKVQSIKVGDKLFRVADNI